ncbi:hypothetical protein PRIPAC_82626 [Pristionchus pacificus]|uniref:Cytochrome P450 n=1 Tax=Pristionchus pacificus TaxID=54126 RepID=A0A2A6CQM3_PRIPA|nr:hypothetical protein PRIPAC_82626 [Pristionchus pacificus]|eukprot:PDM80420.1 cytochrome P450 [Pristionchus pacificus]
MFALLFLLLITFIGWEALRFYRRCANLPPGPFAVPLLGNFINEVKPPYFHVALKRLSGRFGSVFTVHLPYPVVNISDFETIRDTFRGNDVTGRMQNVLIEVTRSCENGGIVASQGASWQEQRRFAIATLRDFGMGKNLMEEKVRLSAKNMVEFIGKQDLGNIDLRWSIQVFVSNIINEFLFGFQYPYEDCGKLMNFVLGLNDAISELSRSRIVPIIFMLPWTRHLPIFSYYWAQHHKRFQTMIDYVRETASAVKIDLTEEPTCYVQAYKKNNKDQRFEQMVACCADLFNAGQETTTTTLRWSMLFLAAHPEVQEKLRSEIHAHIGRDRIASMADKAKMPYASAVINEVQRCANIVAPNPILFHKTTVDTVIGGHKVVANTLVNGDVHQMMKTDAVFEQPDRFWPERYIAEDRVTLRKELVERTIPFGIGKRQCAGEGLARTELFIGLTSLIQNFRVLPLPDSTIDLEPIYTNIHFPKPQNFRLERVKHHHGQ